MFTLPKLNVVGVTDNCAAAGLPVPLPSNGTVAGSVAPTTSIVRLPEALPEAVGLNITAISVLWPGAKSTEFVLVVEKPVPLVLTWDTVTFGPPVSVELVSVRCMVLELPTATLPKLRLEELRPTFPVVWFPAPLGVLVLLDWRLQPERLRTAATVRTAMAACCQ
jgi:hypothetical protein